MILQESYVPIRVAAGMAELRASTVKLLCRKGELEYKVQGDSWLVATNSMLESAKEEQA